MKFDYYYRHQYISSNLLYILHHVSLPPNVIYCPNLANVIADTSLIPSSTMPLEVLFLLSVLYDFPYLLATFPHQRHLYLAWLEIVSAVYWLSPINHDNLFDFKNDWFSNCFSCLFPNLISEGICLSKKSQWIGTHWLIHGL